MGRTVLTFRKILEKERRKWKEFKDALGEEERETFDTMLEDCERHVSASSQSKSPNPFREMVMSILLEQRKKIESMKEEIDEIDKLSEEK